MLIEVPKNVNFVFQFGEFSIPVFAVDNLRVAYFK